MQSFSFVNSIKFHSKTWNGSFVSRYGDLIATTDFI